MIDWLTDLVFKRYGRNILRALLGAVVVYAAKDISLDPEHGKVFIDAGVEVLIAAVGLLAVEVRSWMAKSAQ